MMKSIIKIIVVVLLCTIQVCAIARQKENHLNTKPVVGQKLPYFKLKDIGNFRKNNATSDDFKGKWLLLDFWYQGCATCINSFSKVNSIFSEYEKDLNWVLVGLNDQKYNKGIESLFDKLRKKKNLQVPFAFDSLIAEKWGIHSFPYIIIVNPSGVIHSITGGRDITKEKIRWLIEGQQVSFVSRDIDEGKMSPPTTDSTDLVLYTSVLTRWKGGPQNGGVELDRWSIWPKEFQKQGFLVTMVPLYALYNYAYLGRWTWDFTDPLYATAAPAPVIELKDKSLFDFDYATKGTIFGMYDYHLTLPVNGITKESVMRVMQEDLRRTFNYKVTVKEQEMPVMKLVITDNKKSDLATKGGAPFITEGATVNGFKMVNYDNRYLVASLGFYLQSAFDVAFIDETGIIGNVDFTIDADMTDIRDVRKQLWKVGLDLIESKKTMKVIVISDPDQI